VVAVIVTSLRVPLKVWLDILWYAHCSGLLSSRLVWRFRHICPRCRQIVQR